VLGALLEQVVCGLEKIPEEITQEFVEQKKVIGGRSLRLDQIVKLLVAVTSLKPTFVCIDAMDECAIRDRAKILTSLSKIIQKSPTTRVFLTGRQHIRGEVETRLPGEVVAVSVSPWKDDIIHFIRKRLEEDPKPRRGGRKAGVGNCKEDSRNCLGDVCRVACLERPALSYSLIYIRPDFYQRL